MSPFLKKTVARSKLVLIAIGILAGLRVLMILAFDFLGSHPALEHTTAPEWAQQSWAIGTTLSALVQLTAAIAFLFWVHAAFTSGYEVGREGRVLPRPGRAVSSYFIPFVNIFRPYTDMRSLAWVSDPRDLPVPKEVRDNTAPGYREPAGVVIDPKPFQPLIPLGAWWAAYLGQALLSAAAALIPALVDVLFLVAAGLWFMVVRGVTRGQVERARRLAYVATLSKEPSINERAAAAQPA